MTGFPTYNFVTTPYAGGYTAFPVSLCSTKPSYNNTGTIVTQGRKSYVVRAPIDWHDAYATGAVYFNMQSQGSANPLNEINMLHVDNTENVLPVTIIFPDTQFALTVAAGASGYYPVFTSGLAFFLYNGISGAQGQAGANTVIVICNFATPGFLATQSPDIGGAVQAAYISINLSVYPDPQTCLPAMQAGQYIIRAYDIYITNVTPLVAQQYAYIVLRNDDASYFALRYVVGMDAGYTSYRLIASHDGLDMPLDATKAWLFDNYNGNRTSGGSAYLNLWYEYSQT